MLKQSTFSRRAIYAAMLAASTLVVSTSAAMSDVTPVYISNFSTGVVGSYDLNTGNAINSNLATETNPGGLAVAGGNLFVASNKLNNVIEYKESTGAVVQTFTGFNGANDVFVSGTTLYVSNLRDGSISEYDTTTGLAINSALVSGLGRPYQIAVLGNDLFVAEQSNNRVGEYDATTGAAISVSYISGVTNASGLALSGTTLFVATPTTTAGSQISSYNVSGPTASVINASLITDVSGVYAIAALANDLLVTNFSKGTFSEYDGTSGSTIQSNYISGLNGPLGVAIEMPEPASASLLAVGSFYLLSRRRRIGSH